MAAWVPPTSVGDCGSVYAEVCLPDCGHCLLPSCRPAVLLRKTHSKVDITCDWTWFWPWAFVIQIAQQGHLQARLQEKGTLCASSCKHCSALHAEASACTWPACHVRLSLMWATCKPAIWACCTTRDTAAHVGPKRHNCSSMHTGCLPCRAVLNMCATLQSRYEIAREFCVAGRIMFMRPVKRKARVKRSTRRYQPVWISPEVRPHAGDLMALRVLSTSGSLSLAFSFSFRNWVIGPCDVWP